ncbi:MAG: SPASM domain-containing protein [Patescibacteria group bacterium]|nr:SPASM domain-containing protein [Patescibacteria group bacterium]
MPKPAEVTQFAKRLFDLWLEADDPSFKIRNFRNVIRGLCGGSPLECSSKIGVCRAFIAFDSNGDVYPCHRFVGRRQFVIGNVLEKSLKDIFTGSLATDIYSEMAVIPENCQNCEWLNVCGAGCSYERLIGSGSFGAVSFDCEIKRPLFEHIKEKVKHLI